VSANSWKRTLYSVLAGEFLSIAGFQTSGPIIPFFLGDLGVTDPVMLKLYVGLIQSLPAISLAVMAPIWGSLADNYGRKPMLLRAMFGGAVIMILQGMVTAPWQLLVLRTIQGCITGTVAAATVLIASAAPKEEVGYGLGILQMAIYLGQSLGPMLGGFVSDAYGHRVAFFVTSGLLFVGGLVVLRWTDDAFVPPTNRKSVLKSLVPDFSPLKGPESKALWALLAVVAADMIAGSIASPFLPLFIRQISADSSRVASNTGLILGLGAIMSAAAAVIVGKFSYRLGYQRVLIVCMLGAAAFTLPQAFATSPGTLLALRLASCFFIGGNMPAVNALISARTEPGKQGSVYGLRSTIGSASGAIGPAIGSSIALGAGYGAVFVATGAILALTGGAAVAFARRGPVDKGRNGHGAASDVEAAPVAPATSDHTTNL
jgi:MFS transporter, DHA1 family, multidrug resistance protein